MVKNQGLANPGGGRDISGAGVGESSFHDHVACGTEQCVKACFGGSSGHGQQSIG
jgi:hypothetical protein